AVLNPPDRLEPDPRMDLRLRQHGGLGTEALHDRADKRPHPRRSDEYRRLALTRCILEPLAHERNEFGQARWCHREALVLTLADDRLGEGLLPFGRQRDQRQVAVWRGVLRTDLAG